MIDVLTEYGQAFLYSDGYRLTGLVITLWLTVISVLAGFALALPMSMALVSNRAWVRLPVRFYCLILCGTPLYLQLMMIYVGVYGLPLVRDTPVLAAIFKDGMHCAPIAFALNSAAYTSIIFASALRGVPYGEIEAARACGLSHRLVWTRIVWPRALRSAIPAYSNEVIFVLHATSLASAVTVKDIMAIARDASAATYKSFEAFGTAAAIYLSLSFVLLACFRRLERRLTIHLRRPDMQVGEPIGRPLPASSPQMNRP